MPEYPTKNRLLQLTYNQAEALYMGGHLPQSAWDWYTWKFGQTSIRLCSGLKGMPEPEYPPKNG